jgi:hypothetical protein
VLARAEVWLSGTTMSSSPVSALGPAPTASAGAGMTLTRKAVLWSIPYPILLWLVRGGSGSALA